MGSRWPIIYFREVGKLKEARPHVSHDSKPSLYVCSWVPLNFNYKQIQRLNYYEFRDFKHRALNPKHGALLSIEPYATTQVAHPDCKM